MEKNFALKDSLYIFYFAKHIVVINEQFSKNSKADSNNYIKTKSSIFVKKTRTAIQIKNTKQLSDCFQISSLFICFWDPHVFVNLCQQLDI